MQPIPDYLIPYELDDDGPPLFKLLLYGDPGVGKTSEAATVKQHELLNVPMFLNFEAGLLSVRRLKGIRKIDVRSVSHIEELFWLLVDGHPSFEGIKTIIFDSGSEMQTLDLEEIVQRETEKEYAVKRDPSKVRRAIDDIWQEDYGESASRLGRVYRWYRDSGYNIVMTALPREDKLPTGQVWRVRPSFTPKLSTQVEGMFDLVWYLYADKEKGTRHILTDRSGIYVAKTRASNLNRWFKDQMDGIIDLGDGSPDSHPNMADIYQWVLDFESPGWEPSTATIEPEYRMGQADNMDIEPVNAAAVEEMAKAENTWAHRGPAQLTTEMDEPNYKELPEAAGQAEATEPATESFEAPAATPPGRSAPRATATNRRR